MKHQYRHQAAISSSSRHGRIARIGGALLLTLMSLLTTLSIVAPVAAQEQEGEGTAQVTINTFTCPDGTDTIDPVDSLLASCVTPANDHTFTWVNAEGTLATLSPQNGQVRIDDIEEGSYILYSDVPLDDAVEVASCTADGGNRYTRVFDDNGVTAFDPITREQIVCDWFVIPVRDETSAIMDLTGSLQPEPATQSGINAPAGLSGSLSLQSTDQAQVTINLALCPAGTDESSSFDELDAACANTVDGVVFTRGDATGTIETITSAGAAPIVFDEIEEGTYTLYSDVPLEFASETLFCVADGGNRYQKEFNDNGVTTFGGIIREQIVCDWFITPFDLQGEDGPTPTPTASGLAGDPVVTPTPDLAAPDLTVTPATGGDARATETGGSLVVHLALCPMDYSGDQLFETCHGDGVSDQPFVLTGPDGETEQITTVPQTPGPGIVQFMSLPAGDYMLAGGPPGDFGSVKLYCSTQPDGDRIDAVLDSTRATFTIGDGEDILCDWYYIPENQGGQTPTPSPTVTPEPVDRAEILVTLYQCVTGTSVAGASYADLQDACNDTRDGVPFTLGDVGAPPLTANTGASGAGAVRFFELLPADYTLRPTLPGGLSSVAVYCQLNEGDPYQKTLSDGATTFVNVDGDAIACDWYALKSNLAPDPAPAGPDGSITVRERLCGEDASAITDWERECDAGSSGATFTLASTDGAMTRNATTNAEGIAVFSDLSDGFYTLNQEEGMWCKARAERVDSQSRVIVDGGQNTDVFLYQCTDVTQLPSTGSGPGIGPMNDDGWWQSLSAVRLALMAGGVVGVVMLLRWCVTPRGFAS
ncbi:MAG: hypothetical protein ACR2GS_03200 [Thermomicrobiales bacterium]